MEWAGKAPAAYPLNLCHDEGMKKQASDQPFHDRRHQERQRAEAAKKSLPKKAAPANPTPAPAPKTSNE
jgi:hypothetical protein